MNSLSLIARFCMSAAEITISPDIFYENYITFIMPGQLIFFSGSRDCIFNNEATQ